MFIGLSAIFGLGPVVVLIVFRNKVRIPQKYFCYLLALVCVGLFIGTLVNEILGYAVTSVCWWVALGLGCGSCLAGGILLLITLTSLERNREGRQTSTISVKNTKQASYSTSYIDEIKALKELLDSEAITKEEYDAKKKEILSR